MIKEEKIFRWNCERIAEAERERKRVLAAEKAFTPTVAINKILWKSGARVSTWQVEREENKARPLT